MPLTEAPESIEPETAGLEARYLRSLRLVVERQADANQGIITKDKQRATQQANRIMGMAQADLVQRYLNDYMTQDEDAEGDEPPTEVRFDV